MTVEELSFSNLDILLEDLGKNISDYFHASLLFSFTSEHNSESIYDRFSVFNGLILDNSSLFYSREYLYRIFPVDKEMINRLDYDEFEYLRRRVSNKLTFENSNIQSRHPFWYVYYRLPYELPAEEVFNFSVATTSVNKTIYPSSRPYLSGGISGIIH